MERLDLIIVAALAVSLFAGCGYNNDDADSDCMVLVDFLHSCSDWNPSETDYDQCASGDDPWWDCAISCWSFYAGCAEWDYCNMSECQDNR